MMRATETRVACLQLYKQAHIVDTLQLQSCKQRSLSFCFFLRWKLIMDERGPINWVSVFDHSGCWHCHHCTVINDPAQQTVERQKLGWLSDSAEAQEDLVRVPEWGQTGWSNKSLNTLMWWGLDHWTEHPKCMQMHFQTKSCWHFLSELYEVWWQDTNFWPQNYHLLALI